MMKSIMKYGLTFVMGGLIGAVIARIVLKESYAQAAQHDIDDVIERFGKIKHGDYKSFINVMGKRGATGEELQILADMFAKYGERVVSEPEIDKYHEMADHYGSKSSLDGTLTADINKQKSKYNLVTRKETVSEVEIDTDEEDDDAVDPYAAEYPDDEPVTNEPYLINEIGYSEDFIHFTKASVRYFVGDNVAIDENEEIIDDPDIILGECLDLIVNEKWNQKRREAYYVRNENVGTDYEILCEIGYYQEQVLGMRVDEIDSDFMKKKKSKKGRRVDAEE